MKRFLIGLIALFLSTSLFAQQEIPTPQWRPVYHFAPLKNWTNDPNGLLYLNGVYELYNQQNPYENKWGHMSWGHATSTDLIHWKHYDLAMPEGINDEDTTWRFSGSAVWDKNNTSGLCDSGGCIIAIIQPISHMLKRNPNTLRTVMTAECILKTTKIIRSSTWIKKIFVIQMFSGMNN